jgi:hypothetical protein
MTTDASNPYSNVVAKPSVPPPNNGTKAMHATPPVAPAEIIKQNVANREAHNSLVLNGSGFKVSGGSKSKSKSKRSKRSKSKRSSSKRSSSKRSKRSSSKRSKRSSSKRSKRSSSKRYKRGGAVPTATPTPKPSVVPVPQFPGAHNVSASANSVSINHGLMKAGAQAVYDDPNGPVSTMKIQ